MYDLIEYSDNYSKTSESLLKYYRDKSALTDDDAIKFFHVGNNNSVSFKFKQRMTGVTDADGTKDVEIMVPLKYLGNIWKTLEMPLINCETNLILARSENFLLSNENATTFANTDTKLYVTVVTLSTQDNAKLLEQLKPGFKRTIKWNKYRPEPAIKAQNQYLNHLIDPGFQGGNRLLALSFKNKDDITLHTKYYLLTAEIKDYNAMIFGQTFFVQPIKKWFNNIRKHSKDCNWLKRWLNSWLFARL